MCFSKLCPEYSSFIKSDINNGHFTWRPIHISLIVPCSLEREMFQTKVVQKIKTHILCSFFPPENRAVYENVWKSTVQPGRPQMTAWHKCITWWIRKSKNTHSEYVIPIALPLQQWLHKRVSMLRYTYTACLVICKNTVLLCVNVYDTSWIMWCYIRGLEL